MNAIRGICLSLLILGACRQESAPPNFVLIVADDLPWSALGCYGNEYHETPHLDGLARRGIRFLDAYANAPNCSPSRASLLTGKYPARLGLTDALRPNPLAEREAWVGPEQPRGLLQEEISIAERLQARGYRTACIGKWHLGGEDLLPAFQGFDVTFGGGEPGSHDSMFPPYKGLEDLIPDPQPGEYLTERLTREAVHFVEISKDQPFFLLLSHYAMHRPVQGHPIEEQKYRGKPKVHESDSAEYAAMLQGIDDSTGALLEALHNQGLADRTYVLFFSDNGGTGSETSNRPFREGKGWLYEGGIRVPLIVQGPGIQNPGRDDDTPVMGIDLVSTFLELAGARVPTSEVDGSSLVPLLQEQKLLPRELYWHYPHYSRAGTPPCGSLRADQFKLIEPFDGSDPELYDLESDSGEQHNLAQEFPERTEAMLAAIREWRQSVGARMPVKRDR